MATPPIDPTAGETPADPLAALLQQVINDEPHHRRLYPDLYVHHLAAAARRYFKETPVSKLTQDEFNEMRGELGLRDEDGNVSRDEE